MTYPKKTKYKKKGFTSGGNNYHKKRTAPALFVPSLLLDIKQLQITAITDVAGWVKGEANDPL